jgi:hypothetical protein
MHDDSLDEKFGQPGRLTGAVHSRERERNNRVFGECLGEASTAGHQGRAACHHIVHENEPSRPAKRPLHSERTIVLVERGPALATGALGHCVNEAK